MIPYYSPNILYCFPVVSGILDDSLQKYGSLIPIHADDVVEKLKDIFNDNFSQPHRSETCVHTHTHTRSIHVHTHRQMCEHAQTCKTIHAQLHILTQCPHIQYKLIMSYREWHQHSLIFTQSDIPDVCLMWGSFLNVGHKKPGALCQGQVECKPSPSVLESSHAFLLASTQHSNFGHRIRIIPIL